MIDSVDISDASQSNYCWYQRKLLATNWFILFKKCYENLSHQKYSMHNLFTLLNYMLPVTFVARGQKSGSQQVQHKDSDDEDKYSKEDEPNKEDDSYYYDEVDQFHMEQDKVSSWLRLMYCIVLLSFNEHEIFELLTVYGCFI